ncbi:MAG: hydroxyacid dehydrogenase [Phototrophicales bacterium]|nr:hydroxyacid dehydrogenase [Phototrophicales bacterium]
MTYHVLALDNVDKKAIELLQNVDGFKVTAGNLPREDVLKLIPDADAIVIRSTTQADAELLALATKLKAIARAGVGVDNVDLDEATKRGVVVMNTPDGNTIATAEFAFGLMLALARHIPTSYVSLSGGKWDKKSFVGVELRGKTLGLVGFGRIGRAVAKRALAFDMTVIAYDPFIPEDVARDLGVALVDLDTLYSRSDFISLHSVITDDTKEMINASSIGKMKKGVRIINAARGALINENDLAEAIKSGHVAGVAADVFTVEPPPADHPLLNLTNVLHTPHLAASTTDAQINVGIDAAQEIIDALTKGEFKNVCNPMVLAR